MRYPFSSMQEGEHKQKRFATLAAAKAARNALYALSKRSGKLFNTRLHSDLLFEVWRLPDPYPAQVKTTLQFKHGANDTANMIHYLKENEAFCVEFMTLLDMKTIEDKAQNIARAKGLYITTNRKGMKLTIARIARPKQLSGGLVYRGKYPFASMKPGDCIVLRCSTGKERETTRTAAFVIGSQKGWKFETCAVKGNYDIKVWRIK